MVPRTDTRGRWASLLLFGPAALWTLACVIGIVVTVLDDAAWSAVDRGEAQVAGSERCRGCHPAQYETWHASYHRTMTQEATQGAVLAPFAGETLDALGFRAQMSRTPQGRPHVRITRLQEGTDADPVVLDVDVALTVGSHRYQQYVARIDRGGGPQELWRLPVAWHVDLSRWIHINGAFLTPEGQWGDEADYLRHLSRWNDNCVLCHNTEPVPGKTAQGRFDTRVGELGIGCEACHGPASEHVERHAWPLRRVLSVLREAGAPEGSVAHPGQLSPGLHADVCGRCHGNRIAADIEAVLREGDGFVPGHALGEVSRPILREASLAGQPGQPFAERFWPDGTPRLSAYEYQALLLSPCHEDGAGLSCGDCHTMHGPQPAMQLRPEFSMQAVCTGCHPSEGLSEASIAGVARGGHGGHGDAVACEGCHMPRITYGLLEGMMSHRITRPRPQDLVGAGAEGRADLPDACTQCHVDRSRAWAAAALDPDAAPPGADDDAVSRVALDLHGGDPIQRALALHALTRPEVPVDPAQRMAWLVDGLEDDYPAVRWFGYRGLRGLAEASSREAILRQLDTPGVMEDAGLRQVLIEDLRTALGPGALADDPARRQALHARRDDRAIWIGE